MNVIGKKIKSFLYNKKKFKETLTYLFDWFIYVVLGLSCLICSDQKFVVNLGFGTGYFQN